MNLKPASGVAHNWVKTYPTPMKFFTHDGIDFILVAAPINGDLVWRSSTTGFHKFDISPDGQMVIIYHKLIQDEPTKENPNPIPYVSESDWRDINKLIPHIKPMVEYLSIPDRKNPYPKGLIGIPSSNTREILIGNTLSYKFLYESKQNLKTSYVYADLEDAF